METEREVQKSKHTKKSFNILIILGSYLLIGLGFYIYDSLKYSIETHWEWSSEILISFFFIYLILINLGPIIWAVNDSPHYLFTVLFSFVSVPIALLLFYFAQIVRLPFLELLVLNLGVFIHFIIKKVSKKNDS